MPARILIIKTGALGDVLRTTSVLPGLAARYPGAQITWVTATAAAPLVEGHRLVSRLLTLDAADPEAVSALTSELAREEWDRVLSFDDEALLCRMASAVVADPARISGAFQAPDGTLTYTDDVEPWFGMGLLSRAGKQEADRRKVQNQGSHPRIFADMLGIEMGRPELVLGSAAQEFGRGFARSQRLGERGPVIGLNTGAGERWTSKGLSVASTVELARLLRAELDAEPHFLVLGGPEERERNSKIVQELAGESGLVFTDGGVDNSLMNFASLVGLTDLLVTSDSLALHLGIALVRPIVCFFAPTSASEIELYGLGEKVCSTSPDYCSYRTDADNSSITPGRICEMVMEVLSR